MILSLLPLRGLSVRACLAALPAVIEQQNREKTYQIYVTDVLKLIAENSAKYASEKYGSGKYLEARFADVISPKPKETRTGEEVVEHMKQKIAEIEKL